MAIGSLQFISLLLLLTAVFFQIQAASARRWLVGLCSAGSLALFLPNLSSLLFLSIFLGTGYVVGMYLRSKPTRWVLGAYLLVLVLSFAVVQRYAGTEWMFGDWVKTHTIIVVGLSYMLFRQIHFLVDCIQNQIPKATLCSYVNYQINFLALVAGPIQRFQDFLEFWENPSPLLSSRHDVLKAYLRIFYGVICVVAFSSLLGDLHDTLQAQLASPALLQNADGSPWPILTKIVAVIYVYPLYMYFNFAGYCDIVIGGAVLLGLRLPENFDRPYLARNVLDFWSRWHQSLGFWVRDYLFTPMYLAVAKWNSRAAGSLAFVCYFVAFVVMGIWHGTGVGFLIFGLLHGLGASAAKLWEMAIVSRRGRKGLREYLQRPGIRVFAIFCTLNYFAFSLLFFSPDLEKFMLPWRAFRHAVTGGV